MPPNTKVKEFAGSNTNFQRVLAGKVTVQDFFTKPEFAEDKEKFMSIYKEAIGERSPDSLFNDESVAAAWIAKLRFNQEMTDEQFTKLINRSEEIFKGNFDDLNLTSTTPEENDNCAIMWGIEALNGTQAFDSGATRVRLPEGVAPKIVKALEDGGAFARDSTHATGTKLVDKGLGKDIAQESMRAFTPRGMGALLVVPTSPDGSGTMVKTPDARLSPHIKKGDYDLLLKREDYGFNDSITHSLVHSKVGFLNHLREIRSQYQEGIALIRNKSDLARDAEAIHGKGPQIHRKEHLSELKGQSKTLIDILEAGKEQGLFSDFTTKWTIRIKWPPFEKKIVSADPNSRKGVGDFLHQIAEAEKEKPEFKEKNKENLAKVRGLLQQAEELRSGPFERCREGNEVLVNCQSGKALLADPIAKSTDNKPVNREELVEVGMVSETDPELSKVNQQTLKDSLRDFKEEQEKVSQDTPKSHF
ncbi:hypothetical protein [Legionella sp. 29fVS95]|uniref:hypothetical protein n=1 Tax=Legionella sp. 29fVS95 TaxID=3402813 RepID=UPI003AF7089E